MAQMRIPMKIVIGATEVRNNFGKLINRVYKKQEHLIVEKSGIPVVAIIGIREYEDYQRWLAHKLHQQLGQELGAALDERGITEEQLIVLMEEDRSAVYEQLYGRDV